MSNTIGYEKRLRFAGLCLVIGLLVEAICLRWATPIAFIVFVVVAGLLMFLGLVVYLNSQLSTAISRE